MPEPPQSNQRGIETVSNEFGDSRDDMPQSNQRGIETRDRHPITGARNRLNRTSVGLKQVVYVPHLPKVIGLNRTSVGLKPPRPPASG